MCYISRDSLASLWYVRCACTMCALFLVCSLTLQECVVYFGVFPVYVWHACVCVHAVCVI